MDENWRIQMFSDLVRDGLAIELVDPGGVVQAEVFRGDSDHTLTVSVFSAIPFTIVERLIAEARDRLGNFEDGTPLPSRINSL